MDAADLDRARKALAALSIFPEAALRTAGIDRLFGLTNEVFRIRIGGEALCLRLPGPGTEAIIDRRREETNARAAARAGAAPDVLHFSADGVMLTRFVEGGPLSPQRFRDDPRAIERAAHAMRTLHDRAEGFSGLFDVFERIGFYRDLLGRCGANPSAEQSDMLDEAETIRMALEARPQSPKPCHCDPTGRNLIDDGEKVWLIDWEYSGMNDPAWDLAYLSIEGDFDAGQDRALLAAYLRRPASVAEVARVVVFKALCQLLSGLWALVQHSGGNRSADFAAYADASFTQTDARMRDAGFANQLAALRG